ncbi:MAG: hypothetical protein IJS15_02395 [Victivallales bacterium]|nr:hypothetical protein [Victivallales bacterium]
MLDTPQTRKYERRFELTGLGHPVVVIESDDWGACETVPSEAHLPEYHAIMGRHGIKPTWVCGLEKADEILQIAELLEKHHGAGGISPVFTAFTCVANPDYDAIKNTGYTQYIDIPFNEGVPDGWDATGVLPAMLEAEKRLVWHPEYHARLHHTSHKLWLKFLREDTPDSELARELFDMHIYYIGRHLPEFHGYDNYRELFQSISTGISYFENIFNRQPSVAITSDAYEQVEFIWSCLGIKTIALKCCRVNSGARIIYWNKPWNNQDIYAVPGDYNPDLDVFYLTRNDFCESTTTAEEVIKVAQSLIDDYHEPIIISSHRINYCNYDQKKKESNFKRLDDILTAFDKMSAVYLTSAELGDLARQGWSLRLGPEHAIFHKCSDDAINVPSEFASLPIGSHLV